ncbi:hypothetical protein BWQ96_07645 [Gracilariopsis chorda]|uniref:Peptidase S9 prolyl oligopeptidase catalytic domain-containing protein n=1 Tax=Gracilariopsis chorda TaxID=448386 RepID=A0A2V3IKP4_9FLOR|nr:hypothetical protein BWQ96_07645 [Gracilariopsis chorda]|eukprot:PXF42641.1 hypothetical protein BWQ96_07645 [Gracilariopsis chorda]
MTTRLSRSGIPGLEPGAAIRCEPVPDHEDWRFVGQTLNSGPMPAIIYFSLTAEQSLELDPYNQFVTFLNAGEQSKFRVFSVTLPFHTSDMKECETAFSKWANIYNSGGDLVSGFVRKVSSALNSFIGDGYISPNKIFVAGLSRGALLAAHIAVSNPNIQACLGFSPVTVLHDLNEFSDAEIHSERARLKIRRASLHNDTVISGLMRIPVRFYMGNSDTRVGTRNAFEAVHLVAERAAEEGVRSPPHEFVMYCSVGKNGHGTPPDVFRAGAEYILSLID